jgi:hypothetical protein
LKPVVLLLAMLSATTSSLVWFAINPEQASR